MRVIVEPEKNHFGNSIVVINTESKNIFDGISGRLISKLAIEMADRKMTGGMHFFEVSQVKKDIQRKCDTVICLGGKNLPFDIIEEVGSLHQSIIQIDLDCSHEVSEEERKFEIGRLFDVSRMDLLPATNAIPEKTFSCSELGIQDYGITRNSKKIAERIAWLLGIKIISFKNQTKRMMIEQPPRTDDCGGLMPWAKGPF